MNLWYELTPIDTLFFRGNEPMEAGQATSAPLFPPPVSVVQGALRTALLRERGVAFQDYKRGNVSEEIIQHIGRSGEDAPFSITAILLKFNGIVYAPAPAGWFIDAADKPTTGTDYVGKKVVVASTSESDVAAMGVLSSSGTVSLVVTREEALSLAGCWINIELFTKEVVTFSPGDLLTDSELFTIENRTGIEIDNTRKVVEGKLYSANHIRLHDGVTIIVATDGDVGLPDSGMLQLGGEQRKCSYRKMTKTPLLFKNAPTTFFVALAPVKATEALLAKVVSAHKLIVTAGWDLSRGFHKPTTTWFPAGTLFSEQIDKACIPIAL